MAQRYNTTTHASSNCNNLHHWPHFKSMFENMVCSANTEFEVVKNRGHSDVNEQNQAKSYLQYKAFEKRTDVWNAKYFQITAYASTYWYVYKYLSIMKYKIDIQLNIYPTTSQGTEQKQR